MKSLFDFPEIEGQLQWESEKYDLSHPNWEVAWALLASTQNLKEIHEFTGRTAGDDTDDGKKFQHILIGQGANALESLHWLTKHHQYTAARGRVRYLFETYLVLRGLNRDQRRAAKKWNDVRNEAHSLYPQDELKPLEEQPDALHGLRKEEKGRLKDEFDETDAYSDFYQLLSDRGSHPASFRGAAADNRHSLQNENSVFGLGLVFAFGLAAQYVRTYVGTPTRWEIQNRADHIFVTVKIALHPLGLPTLFKDELFFWNPTRWRSPFVGDREKSTN